MKIIAKIKRKLSFEARTIAFINRTENIMARYTKLYQCFVNQKNEFDARILKIKSSLLSIKNYKNTKSHDHKAIIKRHIKYIRQNKKIILNILEKNHNFYNVYVIMANKQKSK